MWGTFAVQNRKNPNNISAKNITAANFVSTLKEITSQYD